MFSKSGPSGALCVYTGPHELGLPPRSVLKVIQPLYGIPESGLHWYLTNLEHHVGEFSMKQSVVDPCFLYKREMRKLIGLVAIQVDDTFGFGTKVFLYHEEEASKVFSSKPRNFLS